MKTNVWLILIALIFSGAADCAEQQQRDRNQPHARFHAIAPSVLRKCTSEMTERALPMSASAANCGLAIRRCSPAVPIARDVASAALAPAGDSDGRIGSSPARGGLFAGSAGSGIGR